MIRVMVAEDNIDLNNMYCKFLTKDKEIKIEPRILIEDKEKSFGDMNTENMLIHGDNLLALKALEDNFTNKINDENGYRYYSIEYLETILFIKILKKLFA